MADQLITAQELADALQVPLASIPTATSTILITAATAVVQEAAGNQRLIQVVNDPFAIIGLTDSWLDLPQLPVTAVSSVTLDGVALTAGTLNSTYYKLRGNRLWRTDGWQTYYGQPSDVAGLYTHGYATGAQGLELARNSVFSLAKSAFPNPGGVASESIDDYNVTYNAMSAQMEASPYTKRALRKKYGRRAGLARVG
jgi:hypothetical protein